jgi:hypothetical protein
LLHQNEILIVRVLEPELAPWLHDCAPEWQVPWLHPSGFGFEWHALD